jgi:hypothetical protein
VLVRLVQIIVAVFSPQGAPFFSAFSADALAFACKRRSLLEFCARDCGAAKPWQPEMISLRPADRVASRNQRRSQKASIRLPSQPPDSATPAGSTLWSCSLEGSGCWTLGELQHRLLRAAGFQIRGDKEGFMGLRVRAGSRSREMAI